MYTTFNGHFHVMRGYYKLIFDHINVPVWQSEFTS